VIGLPNDTDKSFIITNKALTYLSTFKLETENKDFKSIFPAAPKEALDLLRKLLVFNPYFRLTVDEALAHPFFAPIRDVAKENAAESEIVMEFEDMIDDSDDDDEAMEVI
jgi:mitogen-activated protein kinase 1/3